MLSPFEVSGRDSVCGLGRAFRRCRGGGGFLKDFVFQAQPSFAPPLPPAFDAGLGSVLPSWSGEGLQDAAGGGVPQSSSDPHSWSHSAVNRHLPMHGSMKKKIQALSDKLTLPNLCHPEHGQ